MHLLTYHFNSNVIKTLLKTSFIGLTIRAKMMGRGRPLLPEILSKSGRVGAKFEQ